MSEATIGPGDLKLDHLRTLALPDFVTPGANHLLQGWQPGDKTCRGNLPPRGPFLRSSVADMGSWALENVEEATEKENCFRNNVEEGVATVQRNAVEKRKRVILSQPLKSTTCENQWLNAGNIPSVRTDYR